MKKIVFVLIILTLAFESGCKEHEPAGGKESESGFPADKDNEFADGSGIVFPELNDQLLTNLELLGKIWGFLKYHHPAIGEGKFNWDNELFRILPKYLKANNNDDRDKILTDWINQYGAIPHCATCSATSTSAYIKPDLSWIEKSNINKDLRDKLNEIYQNRSQGEHYYISIETLKPAFLHERSYSGMVYPDAGFRLLALYRYWSMIQYFFPSKYLTDKNWDDVLKEYIPVFISAGDQLEYELAAVQMIGEVNDSHAVIVGGGDAIDASRGDKYAPFRVWFIEGKLVVTEYYNPEFKASTGLEIGDIITHINGETVESIVENLKKYYPASNEPARLRDMSFDLLRSKYNSINIDYISSGQAGQKELHLYDQYSLNLYGWNKVNTDEKCYKLLDGNIGYVTLASIRSEDVSAIISSFSNTKGIIIDIRNYPLTGTDFPGYFVSKTVPFVKYTGGNADNPGEFNFFQEEPLINYFGQAYQGKLVVIVNEITQSAAEYTTMAFRAGDNTTIIGSRTAGADGDVSSIMLPGGLLTRISGIGIYYPDGRQTQRIGIIPDIWIEPTIAGIREGRDELLEMAIKVINEE